jgi:hypothetical protein
MCKALVLKTQITYVNVFLLNERWSLHSSEGNRNLTRACVFLIEDYFAVE